MNGFHRAASLLPKTIRTCVEKYRDVDSVAEFRLRRGLPPTVLINNVEMPLSDAPISRQDLNWVLETASQASPYTVKQSMAQGYVIARGGVRVGLCGQMSQTEGGEYVFCELTSLSIRIPRQVMGCADALIHDSFESTLIISPPGLGKTTLLRDMIRQLSNQNLRVGLCDERGEVAAFSYGEAGGDVGCCTDVITGMPKAQSAMAILRAMNPQILAMDEITAPEDVAACAMAANCGVKLLATAHAGTREELEKRDLYRDLLGLSAFHRIIRITMENGIRHYKEAVL